MQAEVGFFAEPRNWVVLAFFLFFIIFGKKLWSALAGMLDARAASVRAEMDEAARLKSEAQAMLKLAQEDLESLKRVEEITRAGVRFGLA